ncbi:hypothetical protein GCM10009627_22840 [Curtobacterium herbarum]|uniref:Uncharacterized protein n=2 Tax=Curtobacterium herbarum TaxID=150122 RepID=A0ABN1ZE27_9MICO
MTSMSDMRTGERGVAAAMWVVLVLGCGVVVAMLWFGAMLDVFTLGVMPTPAATASGRASLNAAAVVSVAAASTTVVLAVVLLWRGVHRVGAAVALVLALCAPWVPVWIAMNPVLAGE